MLSENNSSVAFDFLSQIVPVDGIVHIGAGVGLSAKKYVSLGTKNVFLVEADCDKFKRLKKNYRSYNNWKIYNKTIASNTESVEFYTANNSSESGILNPSSLSEYWKNLHVLKKTSMSAISLKDFLAECVNNTKVNWLIVDCLPSVAILKSMRGELGQFDLIKARVVFDEVHGDISGSTKGELHQMLICEGFKDIHIEESINPRIGYVLYTRDWLNLTSNLNKEIASLQSENDRLKKSNSELDLNLNKEIASLQSENDRLKKSNSELEDRFVNEVKALQAENNKLKCSYDDLNIQLNKCLYREELIDRELIKNEAQIEFIKDILLRERTL
jgi:FkbM family methyltransferase